MSLTSYQAAPPRAVTMSIGPTKSNRKCASPNSCKNKIRRRLKRSDTDPRPCRGRKPARHTTQRVSHCRWPNAMACLHRDGIGRGIGLGRGLGVGVDLGVAVGLAVGPVTHCAILTVSTLQPAAGLLLSVAMRHRSAMF
jgi:hypothetical protein